jgi:Zn-dependent protease with chaperone function
LSKGAPGAARSAAALAGFLIVAGLQLAVVLIALWAVLWLLPSSFALRIGVPLSLATFGTLAYATWRALHTRHRTPAGVAVGRDQAPRLWELVDGAAAAAGVPVPDGVTVVADATATLGERTRLLGLIGGRRDLYLGLPLFQALDTDRLKAVVAHELAHGSPALGRWAPLAYRGRVAVGRTLPRISRRSPAGAALRAYAGFYRRIDAPFGREQEFAADRIAAAHAGDEAAVAALRDLPALAGMQRLFHAEYVGPGWQAGYVPDDVFGGLLRVLAARTTEMSMLRAREPEPSGPWDPHPPLSERIAALSTSSPDSTTSTSSSTSSSVSTPTPTSSPEPASSPSSSSPEPASSPSSSEPVDELVPDLPALGRALQAVAFPPRGRAVVSWDECLSVARTAEMEREAEAALAAISRAVGSPVPDAGELLTLAADGRLRTAAGKVFPDVPPEETTARIVELLGLMLALSALRSGVARWRHSWTGAAEVVGADGTYLNLAELAAAAADPETTEAVRAYLTEAGVDLAAAASRPGSARAQVLGGLVNLSADGARTDVLITDLGLLLVPGLPRGRGPESKRRLTRIAADGVPVGGMAVSEGEPSGNPAGDGLALPGGGRFVPFADVTGVTTTAGRRRSWTLDMRDGPDLTLRSALDTDELPGGWSAWDEAVTFLAGTR